MTAASLTTSSLRIRIYHFTSNFFQKESNRSTISNVIPVNSCEERMCFEVIDSILAQPNIGCGYKLLHQILSNVRHLGAVIRKT